MKVRQLKHYSQSGMAWNNWMRWLEKRNYTNLEGFKTFKQGRRGVPFPDCKIE